MKIISKIEFPTPTGIVCNMMPFVQGDSKSLPEYLQPYSKIIDSNYLEKGEIGHLTVQESFVNANKSQRGYNNANIKRNVHIEVGRKNNMNQWGSGSTWGRGFQTLLDNTTEVLIANSIDNTCRVWNNLEKSPTKDGDLSHMIDKYPENTGILLKAGELAKISIFSPHEAIAQTINSIRQFFRIVGKGVHGREDYFTINPLLS